MSRPRIVVVGGGAGGLELVTRLGKTLGKHKQAEITLVDRAATHVWKPLYHELATGLLNSALDEVSFQAHASNHHYRFLRGSMQALDRSKREITLEALVDNEGNEILPERSVEYDYLVLALGSVANDFGVEGVAEHCHFIDTAEQAESFHTDLLNTFLRINDASSRDQRELRIGIVGGGATGVELAAELTRASGLLHNYGYTDLEHSRLHIHVIEMADRILPPLNERISKTVHKELEELGIKVHVKTAIKEAKADGLQPDSGDFIATDLSVWAAGIKAPDFLSDLGLDTQKNNQITVQQTMQSVDDRRIFALGDCAYCPQGEEDAVPPRAQAAHQQAKQMAENLQRLLRGDSLKDFRYRDKGSLVSLANYETVGNIKGALSSRGVFIEGVMAGFAYRSLYRMHQVTIHGPSKTAITMISDSFNRYLKSRLKLH
ncbi:NAD(P)/FAD-dependent oxidoreductase [Aliidiomarina sp. Khilg15.8]